MKQIIGITLAWILVSTVSFAQVSTTENVVTAEKSATCIPTKECAEKAGMTLDECIKTCLGNKSAESSTAVASASKVSEVNTIEKKSCASTCKSKSKVADNADNSETKVAAASMVSDVQEVDASASTENTKVKKCDKSSKACCKKKG